MRQVIIAAVGVMGVGGWLYAFYHFHRARQTSWKRGAERWQHSIKALGGMALAALMLLGLFTYVTEGGLR